MEGTKKKHAGRFMRKFEVEAPGGDIRRRRSWRAQGQLQKGSPGGERGHREAQTRVPKPTGCGQEAACGCSETAPQSLPSCLT